MSSPAVRRIDVHHHVLPPTLDVGLPDLKLGWTMPEENVPWSPELSIKAMDELNIEMAILSYPPGVPAVAAGDSGAIRKANEALKQICEKYPEKFGFFACLGDLRNVQDVLEELRFAFDELKANGVSITSSYGQGEQLVYVGDDMFDPIWEELDHRGAAVFLHGSTALSSKPNPHATLGIPVVEVPSETFKAASHLVVTGKKRRFSNVKLILSHFGGSAPFLAPRVAVLSHYMGSSLTREEIIADFKTFYYDTALSAYDHTLVAMKAFVAPEMILYGTDFPAVSREMAGWYTRCADDFYGFEEKKLVMRTNLLRILSNVKNDG